VRAGQLDEAGHLLNPDEAVGEIVNTSGVFLFEGYYKDEESTRQRTRNGCSTPAISATRTSADSSTSPGVTRSGCG